MPGISYSFRLPILFLIVGWSCLCGEQRAHAQAGAPDPLFHAGDTDYYESTPAPEIALQPDGKILLATPPDFYSSSITRLNADGSPDATFKMHSADFGHAFFHLTALPHQILALRDNVLCRYLLKGIPDPAFAVDSSLTFTDYLPLAQGQVLAWGKTVVLFRADGSPDPAFHQAAFSDGDPAWLLPDGTGKFYLGGAFTAVDGIVRSGLVRLNSDGTVDTSFHPLLAKGFQVSRIGIEPSAQLLVFGSLAGKAPVLLRLGPDGHVDDSFQPTGMAKFVSSDLRGIFLTPGGKILLWGNTQSDPSALLQLNADGSLDSSFSSSVIGDLEKVIPLPDGGCLVAGKLDCPTALDSLSRSQPVVRLKSDGSADPAFDMIPEAQYGYLNDSYVYDTAESLILQPNGKLLALFTAPHYDDGGGGGVIVIGVGGSTFSTLDRSAAMRKQDVGDVSFYKARVVRFLVDGPYPPHRPTSIKTVSVSPQLTTITWNSVPDVTGYRVERQAPAGQWALLVETGPKTTFYKDVKTDNPPIDYLYRVEAENQYGASLPSAASSPNRPTSFDLQGVIALGPTQVSLSWSHSSAVWNYGVYRKGENANNFKRIAILSSHADFYLDTTVKPLKTYTYQVQAQNVSGASYTSEVSVRLPFDQPPATPEGFLAGFAGPGEVRMLWKPSLHATGYRVERGIFGQGWTPIAELHPTKRGYVDKTLTTGQSYLYRVVAFDGVGDSVPTQATWIHAPGANEQIPATLDPSFSPSPALKNVSGVQVSKHAISYVNNLTSYHAILGRVDLQGLRNFRNKFDSESYNDLVYGNLADGGMLVYTPAGGLKRFKADGQASDFNPPVLDISEDDSDDSGLPVSSILQLHNGNFLVLGQIDEVGSADGTDDKDSYGVVQLKPDGTRDRSFAMIYVDGDAPITAIEQSDGKILVLEYYDLYRLLPNGHLDRTFGSEGIVQFVTSDLDYGALDAQCLALQPDGKILVGGGFEVVEIGEHQALRNGLVRLTADGKIDPTFQTGTGFPPLPTPDNEFNYQAVGALTVDAKGRILVQSTPDSTFLRYDGLACHTSLLRLLPDGRWDPTFFLPDKFDATNFTLSPDNKTFYAGSTLRRYFYGP